MVWPLSKWRRCDFWAWLSTWTRCDLCDRFCTCHLNEGGVASLSVEWLLCLSVKVKKVCPNIGGVDSASEGRRGLCFCACQSKWRRCGFCFRACNVYINITIWLGGLSRSTASLASLASVWITSCRATAVLHTVELPLLTHTFASSHRAS